jgi:hypothetical protein
MPQRFSFTGQQFYEFIIAPQFADMAPDAQGYDGMLNEFTVMDNVVGSRNIIDIRRHQNIMQRRDASCDIIYKNLFGATSRKITVEEVYAAVRFCRNEFYQGCLKEFRANDPFFGNKITPFFRAAVNTDLATNSYFGDVNRVAAANAAFSTDQFDGVFTWLKRYTTASVIPSAQTIQISDGTDYTTTPASAYAVIKALYDKQPQLMYSFTDAQKAFYVSKEIARGYEEYMIASGSGTTAYIDLLQNGVPNRRQLSYKSIAILEQPLWTPVISQIKGSAGYAAILTLRSNFIWATDKSYGEGPDGTTAFEVWYDIDAMTWKWRYFLKAGTQIALPEYTTYALTSFS